MGLDSAVSGALLGTFVGDAVGAPWEGGSPTPAGVGEVLLAKLLTQGELRYTDDTQMALALAEHLCAVPEVELEGLAKMFVEHFEPDRGYGRGTRTVVERLRAGVPATEAAAANEDLPGGSMGNGAAMRVAPVGAIWAHDPDRLAAVARRSALVTDTHPVGVDGAVVQASAVGLAVARGRFGPDELAQLAEAAATSELRDGLADAARLCAKPPEHPVEASIELGTSALAHRSVPAALWIAATADDFADGITRTLELGGDVDTIAAMAGAVLGAAAGVDAIPDDWLAVLENGPRGRDYAFDLATRLAAVGRRLNP